MGTSGASGVCGGRSSGTEVASRHSGYGGVGFTGERKGAWYGSVCDAARSGMGLMLEREEFQAAMVRVYAGLDDINAHLRELNGRTGRSEGRLTVMETVFLKSVLKLFAI